MEANYAAFNHEESARRIRDILAIPDGAFVERDGIPAREELTFENGFYVNASALFVDIRGSKSLSEKYKLPQLARFNRVFVSEMVAVLRDHPTVREMFIEGDCVWAIYNSEYQSQINMAFNCAAQAISLSQIASHYLIRNGYESFRVGVGLHYGRALMLKAGHKGSGINEVVWSGKLVGRAAQLCSWGNRYPDLPLMVDDVVYGNLTDNNKRLLTWNYSRQCYHGDVVNITMNEWLTAERAAGR